MGGVSLVTPLLLHDVGSGRNKGVKVSLSNCFKPFAEKLSSGHSINAPSKDSEGLRNLKF